MRDRAYERVVTIYLKDKARMEEILADIPRDVLRKHYSASYGIAAYILKIKKQELLMIKLAIEVISVTR